MPVSVAGENVGNVPPQVVLPMLSRNVRHAFVSSSVFYFILLFMEIHGGRLTYAASSNSDSRHQIPLVATILIAGFFYMVIAGAAFSQAFIGLGVMPSRYRLWLNIALGCSVFISMFIGVLELVYSIYVGYGFTEPLTWLLIANFHLAVTLGAYRSVPPQPLRPIKWVREASARLRNAIWAFWVVVRTSSVDWDRKDVYAASL